MYMTSAAVGPQAAAIAAACASWGEGQPGREQIAVSVCKKKYQPSRVSSGGRREKMFGCHLHHAQRKSLIDSHGLRVGWESFDQWDGASEMGASKRELRGSLTPPDQQTTNASFTPQLSTVDPSQQSPILVTGDGCSLDLVIPEERPRKEQLLVSRAVASPRPHAQKPPKRRLDGMGVGTGSGRASKKEKGLQAIDLR
ncbi:unnamed protein product [Discosporangium mesarthrocarpum]